MYLRSSPAALNQLFSGCCASRENSVLGPAPEAAWHTESRVDVSTAGFETLSTGEELTEHQQGLFADCLWAGDELPAIAELPFHSCPGTL